MINRHAAVYRAGCLKCIVDRESTRDACEPPTYYGEVKYIGAYGGKPIVTLWANSLQEMWNLFNDYAR